MPKTSPALTSSETSAKARPALEPAHVEDDRRVGPAVERDRAGVAAFKFLVAAADHALDQPALVDGAGRLGGDEPAVAEDRDGVGDRQNVVEEVRDEDDAAAAGAHAAQHLEQALHLGRRQSRGRLVEDDDARAREQHAGELDQLLQADRQRAHARVRIDIDAEVGEMPARTVHHGAPVDDAALRRLLAEIDVLGHREVGHDAQLLVDHADAGRQRLARRAEMHGPAVDRHAAVVLAVQAGDDLHQGRLAGTVLADQAVDFAGAQHEVDVAQGRDAAERLGDAAQFERRRGFFRHADQIRK